MSKHRKAYGTIPEGCDVHHIDWDPKNNDPDNLIALPDHAHVAIHRCKRSSMKTRAQVEQLIRTLDEYEAIKSKGFTSNQKLLWCKRNPLIAKALGIKLPKKRKKKDLNKDLSWLPYNKQYDRHPRYW